MAVNESLRVIKTVRYDALHYSVFLQAGRIGEKAQPGHFAMIQTGEGSRPFLRRAFSIADVNSVSGVPCIEFVVKVVGLGTRLLGQFSEGAQVPVLGPLGVPFPLKDLSRHDRVALVAGGIGLAPLLFLAHRLSEKHIQADLFYGGRNEVDILKRPEFERLLGAPRCRYATDDGSLGRKGRVTDLLEKSIESGVVYRRVYACGPVPMFKTLSALLDAARLEGIFALESEMACGFGVCLGCVAPTVDGRFATVCSEGPCLPHTVIDWEKM